MKKESAETNSGAAFEIEVLGARSNFDQKATYEYAPLSMCVREAQDIARVQGWARTSPDPSLLIAKLYEEVVAQAYRRYGSTIRIKIWRSVGTRLDYLHGIDGFFTAKAGREAGTRNKGALYLFDLSLYPCSRHKLDIDIFDRSCFERQNLPSVAGRILDGLYAQLA